MAVVPSGDLWLLYIKKCCVQQWPCILLPSGSLWSVIHKLLQGVDRLHSWSIGEHLHKLLIGVAPQSFTRLKVVILCLVVQCL